MSDETTIVQKVLEGEVDAFRFIIEKYNKRVFSIVCKRIPFSDCNETVHDIFLEIFNSLKNYKESLSFNNWLVRIAMRKCYDYWRNRLRQKEKMFVYCNGDEKWFSALEESRSLNDFKNKVNKEATIELVQLLLENLSPEDRLLIDMIYFEGHAHADVAGVLNWKLSKVKVRAMRAKQKLRKKLEALLSEKNEKK